MSHLKAITSIDSIKRSLLAEIVNPTLPVTHKRVVVISDVHLGHRRVPTTKIIGLLKEIFNPKRMEEIDLIIITGDLFDRRLSYDSEEAWECTQWCKHLLKSAKKHNVMIRVLNGTPSHDEGQGIWLPRLNDYLLIGADVRYYDKVTADTLYEGGPTALWIPDEVNHDSSVTWKQAQEAIRGLGVDKVDYGFMHGMFTYQEPIRTVVSHLEERYFEMVRFRIVIGHHHTHTTNGIIVVPGSLERLRMNEEEDKGHYQFTIGPEGISDEHFVVNEQATLFTTLDTVGMSYGEVVKLLNKYLSCPEGTTVRIKITKNDDAFASLGKLKQRFAKIKLGTKLIDVEETSSSPDELIDRPVMTTIRPDTLPEMMRPKLTHLSPDVMAVAERIMANK